MCDTVCGVINVLSGCCAPLERCVHTDQMRSTRYCGQMVAFAFTASHSILVVFETAVRRSVEAQTHVKIATTAQEDNLHDYAVFQLIVVSIMFALQTTSYFLRQTTTTTTTDTTKVQPQQTLLDEDGVPKQKLI